MSVFGEFLRRTRMLLHGRQFDREMEEEMRLHRELRERDAREAGADPDEARYAAQRRLGNELLLRERSREAWGWSWLEHFVQDLFFGLRMLRKSPGFTAVATLTLALGIGANTAIFTLINVVMLKALPVSNPEELVMLTWNYGGAAKSSPDFTRALWEQIRERQDVFAGLFVYGPTTGTNLGAGGESRPVAVGLVSGEFFSTLGVHAVAGRTLTNADDQRGCPSVAVITHKFWQSEYGGTENVVGHSVAINSHPFQIVGVTEPGFFGLEFGYDVPIWAPRCAGAPLGAAARFIAGRPKPGVSLEQIRARLATLAPAILEATLPANLSAQTAEQYRRSTFDVGPFSKGFRLLQNTYGEALLILTAVVGVVLLIACANVANLLLARATAREKEIAVRGALGAGRGRLIRQLVTESFLLSLIGAAVGALFAVLGSRVLVGFLSPPRQPIALDLSLDGTVFAFTMAVSVLTAVLFGLAPVWRAVHVEPHSAMKQSGSGVVGGLSRFATGRVLVVAQIALSLVAIVGAGLLLGSWRRLVAVDPGFRRDNVLLASVNVSAAQVPDDRLAVTYRSILESLRALPGVRAASATGRAPMSPVRWRTMMDVMDLAPASENSVSVQLNEVSDGYFAAMGIPILAGRDFNSSDTPTSPQVAIVNQELAQKVFGGAMAVGRRVRTEFFYGMRFSPLMEIVGIVANTKQNTLGEADEPMVYLALNQDPTPELFNFVLSSDRPLTTFLPGVKAAIAEINPRLPVELTTMNQQLDQSLRLPRTLGFLSGFFGVLALLLASVGLYGLTSYAVARRRNEIGIRIALGATQAHVMRMVLTDVASIAVAGVAFGAFLSLAVTRLVSKFLFGVAPDDPATFAFSALTLVAVAIGAAMWPARRAARVDPMVALKYE